MKNIKVIYAANPAACCAHFGAYQMPLRTDALRDPMPGALDLLLAGLGADTTETIMARANAEGWPVDGVYVEVAMHGESPWRAIGRRIWIDGDINDQQLRQLLVAVDRSPVVEALNPNMLFRSAASRLPRPDRSNGQ